jgi:hypothetical protein
MANKKVSTKSKAKKTAAKPPKKEKVPFYAQPARLFSAAADGKLPRGVYAQTNFGADTIRVGNGKLCVYEGKLSDMVTALLRAKGIKLNESAAIIPSPASPSASAAPAS